MKSIKKRAVYIHCYDHALNLACNDAIKECKTIQNVLENSGKTTKQMKCQPVEILNIHTFRVNELFVQLAGQ